MAPLDFIWLELTPRCNLRCVHCYADSGPSRPINDRLELRDWKAALVSAASCGCKAIQFIGGEPTLHPDLPILIEYARAAGYEKVSVFTNGTHLTNSLKTILVANNVDLAFSFYGSNATVHEKVTCRRGSFAKTKASIEWAVASQLKTHVGVIDVGSNKADISTTVELLRSWGVPSIQVDQQRAIGRGADGRLPLSQLNELCGRCGDGKLCVASNGNIYPCVFARFAPVGHALTGGITDAMTAPGLKHFRAKLEKQRQLDTVLGARSFASNRRPHHADDGVEQWNPTPSYQRADCVPTGLKRGNCVPTRLKHGDCVPTGLKRGNCVPTGLKREDCVPTGKLVD